MKNVLLIVALSICCGCQTPEGNRTESKSAPEHSPSPSDQSPAESSDSQTELLVGDWTFVDHREITRGGEIRPGKIESRTYRFTRDGQMISNFDAKYGGSGSSYRVEPRDDGFWIVSEDNEGHRQHHIAWQFCVIDDWLFFYGTVRAGRDSLSEKVFRRLEK